MLLTAAADPGLLQCLPAFEHEMLDPAFVQPCEVLPCRAMRPNTLSSTLCCHAHRLSPECRLRVSRSITCAQTHAIAPPPRHMHACTTCTSCLPAGHTCADTFRYVDTQTTSQAGRWLRELSVHASRDKMLLPRRIAAVMLHDARIAETDMCFGLKRTPNLQPHLIPDVRKQTA